MRVLLNLFCFCSVLFTQQVTSLVSSCCCLFYPSFVPLWLRKCHSGAMDGIFLSCYNLKWTLTVWSVYFMVENNWTSHWNLNRERSQSFSKPGKKILIIEWSILMSHHASCCLQTLCVSWSLRIQTLGFGSDPGKPHLVWVCEINMFLFYSMFFDHIESLCQNKFRLFCSVCSVALFVHLVLLSSSDDSVCTFLHIPLYE